MRLGDVLWHVLVGLVLGIFLTLCALEMAHAGEVYPIERVVRIIDGDTFIADLSLGLGTLARRTIRLRDVCAQELSEVGGLRAKHLLAEELSARSPLSLEVTGRSFDRLEGIVRHHGMNMNAHVQAELVAAGLDGGRGVCP